jgi:hypothetical protein
MKEKVEAGDDEPLDMVMRLIDGRGDAVTVLSGTVALSERVDVLFLYKT